MHCKLMIFTILLGISSVKGNASTCEVFGPLGLSQNEGHSVENYLPIYQACEFKGGEILSLRSFTLNSKKVNFVVNPESSESSIITSECLTLCRDVGRLYFSGSHYGSNYLNSFLTPFPLTNDGLTFGPSEQYLALTIDMCPSSKGISSRVYKKIEELSHINSQAIPVGIAMTRRWALRWSDEFSYIKKLHLAGKMSVDWINHSSNHKYVPEEPLSNNFLLLPGTDMKDEVLGNEIFLIEKGVTPSIYFRFPGLVSDVDSINYVAKLGLVTLGSDAWLAKGEEPVFGSLILIHGNKNEVVGENKLMSYLKNMIDFGHVFGSLSQVLD